MIIIERADASTGYAWELATVAEVLAAGGVIRGAVTLARMTGRPQRVTTVTGATTPYRVRVEYGI